MRDRTLAKLAPGDVLVSPPRIVLSTRRLAGGTVRYTTVDEHNVAAEEGGSPRSRTVVANPDSPLDLVALARARGGYDEVPPGAQDRLRQLAAVDYLAAMTRRAQAVQP